MNKIISLIFTLSLVCSSFVLAPCASAGTRLFEDLKSEYLLLRNRDPLILNPSKWLSLAQKIEKVGCKRLNNAECDQALFMAATLYVEMAERKSLANFDSLRHALILLRDISGRGGEYADDALARACETYLNIKNTKAAESVIQELKLRFPGSEFVAVVSAELERKDTSLRETSVGARVSPGSVDVVLDPGHGGDDLGAQGYAGLLEKDVTLSIAQLTIGELKRSGITYAVTRRGDDFLPLSSRTKFANQHNAKLFVSIHANASLRGTNRGVETYILDSNQSANTKLLVERENGPEASDLSLMLGDIIQREKRPEALKLGSLIQNHIVLKLRQSGFNTPDLGVKRAPFFVLVGTHMPSVLVEVGFIDHSDEGRKIGTDGYRAAVASALASAIKEFLAQQKRN